MESPVAARVRAALEGEELVRVAYAARGVDADEPRVMVEAGTEACVWVDVLEGVVPDVLGVAGVSCPSVSPGSVESPGSAESAAP